jgi:hypothetical protein
MKLYVMMSHFKIGREHYLRKEYEQAVEHFILGLIDCHNPYCMMWLGNCYERGLGVERIWLKRKIYIGLHRFGGHIARPKAEYGFRKDCNA